MISIILNERLNKYIENIIHPNQGAFLKGKSTNKHLFALHTIIKYSKSIRKTYCAYDFISRSYIFTKLANSGVQGNFIKVIKSMYSKTKTYINATA